MKVDSQLSLSDLENELLRLVRGYLIESDQAAVDELSIDTDLVGWGLDSLKVVEVIFVVETAFDVILNEDSLMEVRTIRDLAKLLEQDEKHAGRE